METSSKSPPDAVAERVRAAFREQAYFCTRLGSPFTALLCTLLADRLDQHSEVGARILGWRGDPSSQADALSLRVCGALHGLVRSGREPALAALYPKPGEAFEPDHERLAEESLRAIQQHPDWFDAYLATAPQTNEVGRSAVLMCGFLRIASRYPLPMRLFEIGASAGLNLIADRYRYRFGPATWGDAQAKLVLEPQWQGPPPPTDAPVRVIERIGCDLAPLDIASAAARERLTSYIWADQFDRLARLDSAMATALGDPPRLEPADAADWVESRISDSGGPPAVRVLFHSIVWRYFPVETQRRIEEHMEARGARASAQSPLAWLRYELIDKAPGSCLTLKSWPGGQETVLAYAQPHGRKIESVD